MKVLFPISNVNHMSVTEGDNEQCPQERLHQIFVGMRGGAGWGTGANMGRHEKGGEGGG
jgi:hypothetical protein